MVGCWYLCMICDSFWVQHWYHSLGRDSESKSKFGYPQSAQNWFLIASGCSSLRDEAPAPNRVRNGVRTCPHAPLILRHVRSSLGHAPGVTTCARHSKSFDPRSHALAALRPLGTRARIIHAVIQSAAHSAVSSPCQHRNILEIFPPVNYSFSPYNFW